MFPYADLHALRFMARETSDPHARHARELILRREAERRSAARASRRALRRAIIAALQGIYAKAARQNSSL